MIEDNSVGDGRRRTDTAARITQRERERETEEKITFFSVGMILRLWKHILRRQREHAALVSCLFVGEIWAVSNEFLITEMGTHYHFCILSPFHSSSGFVSTKSAKAVFFCCRILFTCKSVRSYLCDERVEKLLKVNVLTPQHVGIVTAFCILHLSKNRIDHISVVPDVQTVNTERNTTNFQYLVKYFSIMNHLLNHKKKKKSF